MIILGRFPIKGASLGDFTVNVVPANWATFLSEESMRIEEDSESCQKMQAYRRAAEGFSLVWLIICSASLSPLMTQCRVPFMLDLFGNAEKLSKLPCSSVSSQVIHRIRVVAENMFPTQVIHSLNHHLTVAFHIIHAAQALFPTTWYVGTNGEEDK